MNFSRHLGFILLLLMPTAAVIFTFWRGRKKDALKSVMPFEELQRRPAGESTRLKLEEFNEKIDVWLMTLAVLPLVLGIALSFQPRVGYQDIALFFLATAVAAAVAQRKLRPLLNQLRRYRLGFQGERYEGEELNQLVADGYRVFHDVPFEKFNMDHVIVGRTGVFVVETKTKRKPVMEGEKRYKVAFDGTTLRFPHGNDTNALEQIDRNRKTLSQWLSAATQIQSKDKESLLFQGGLSRDRGDQTLPCQVRKKFELRSLDIAMRHCLPKRYNAHAISLNRSASSCSRQIAADRRIAKTYSAMHGGEFCKLPARARRQSQLASRKETGRSC